MTDWEMRVTVYPADEFMDKAARASGIAKAALPLFADTKLHDQVVMKWIDIQTGLQELLSVWNALKTIRYDAVMLVITGTDNAPAQWRVIYMEFRLPTESEIEWDGNLAMSPDDPSWFEGWQSVKGEGTAIEGPLWEEIRRLQGLKKAETDAR